MKADLNDANLTPVVPPTIIVNRQWTMEIEAKLPSGGHLYKRVHAW